MAVWRRPDSAAPHTTAVGELAPSCLCLLTCRLEVVSDAAALTSTMLQVLPVCSPSIQRQLIGILPEVAQPGDHGLVLEQLQGLLEADVTFMAPVVECLSNMMLDAAVQVGKQGPGHQQRAHADQCTTLPVAAAQQPAGNTSNSRCACIMLGVL